MRIIIAGSRTITDYKAVAEILDRRLTPERGVKITEVVVGGARGVDTLAERWAQEHGHPVKRFPADWNRFGRSAGMIRNRQMAEYAAATPAADGLGGLLALWDGQSPGTRNMIHNARDKGLLVDVYLYTDTVQGVASGSDTPGGLK